MKILVFSDTHGMTDRLNEIIGRNRADTDLVIHLGDKFTDCYEVRNEYPNIAFISVSGNCDYISSVMSSPYEYSVTLEEKKFYITHGHLKGVKNGIYGLYYDARNTKSDIVLYGHTHVAKLEEKDGILFFNPGSLTLPRGSSVATYGKILLSGGKINCEICEVE